MGTVRQKNPANRIWTGDLRISSIDNYSPPLYQLSYRGSAILHYKPQKFQEILIILVTMTTW